MVSKSRQIKIPDAAFKNLQKRKAIFERDAGIRIPMTRWIHFISTKPVFVDIPIKKLASRKFKLPNEIAY